MRAFIDGQVLVIVTDEITKAFCPPGTLIQGIQLLKDCEGRKRLIFDGWDKQDVFEMAQDYDIELRSISGRYHQ